MGQMSVETRGKENEGHMAYGRARALQIDRAIKLSDKKIK